MLDHKGKFYKSPSFIFQSVFEIDSPPLHMESCGGEVASVLR